MPANPVPASRTARSTTQGRPRTAARVLSMDEQVDIPFGSFSDVLQTEDTTPLEPDVLEHKYYARGVGPVLTIDVNGGGREELILFENAAARLV